jgi:exodeoxyribonuclease VII small subunit
VFLLEWADPATSGPDAEMTERNAPTEYNRAMPDDKTLPATFEASLEELERVVKQLEKGDLPLEQSLALFETGMKLSAGCKRQLEEAETRVEILMKRGTEIVPVPFNPDATAK